MLTDDAKALLEAGSGLIVGLTAPDGRPHATRGYGLDLDAVTQRGLLLLDADEAAAVGLRVGDEPGVPIAITGANVRTLVSAQVKGRLIAIEAAGAEDHARKDRYCDDFCGALQEADGMPRELAERWRPTRLVRGRIVLDEIFVQTPGPGAGASLGKVAG